MQGQVNRYNWHLFLNYILPILIKKMLIAEALSAGIFIKHLYLGINSFIKYWNIKLIIIFKKNN